MVTYQAILISTDMERQTTWTVDFLAVESETMVHIPTNEFVLYCDTTKSNFYTLMMT